MQQILVNPSITVIRPQSSLHAANASKFEWELTIAIVQNPDSILLVDLEQVEFIDSDGLMALVSGLNLAQSLGQRLSFCSVSPAMRIIFELTQIDRVVEIFECKSALTYTLCRSF